MNRVYGHDDPKLVYLIKLVEAASPLGSDVKAVYAMGYKRELAMI